MNDIDKIIENLEDQLGDMISTILELKKLSASKKSNAKLLKLIKSTADKKSFRRI